MENSGTRLSRPGTAMWIARWEPELALLKGEADPAPPRRISGAERRQGRPQRHRISRRNHPSSVSQLVYFIQASTGQIKIGTAHRPEARLGELQMGHPEPLTLLGVSPGGAPLEGELHAEFTADWIRGEWFRPTDRLLAKIQELTKAA